MELIVITSIICFSVFICIFSVLLYFAKFHKTAELARAYQELEKVSKRLLVVEDDMRKINLKMRYK